MPTDLIICIMLAVQATLVPILLKVDRRCRRDVLRVLLIVGAVSVGFLFGLLGIEEVRSVVSFPVFLLVAAGLAWFLRKPKKEEKSSKDASADFPKERHDYTDVG